VGGKIIAMWTLEKKFARLWGGFIWLRRGSIKGLFWRQSWTFLYHKRHEIDYL